jgi:hypothetical protein
MSYLDLTDEDLYAAQKELNHTGPKLGQWVLNQKRTQNLIISEPRLLLATMLWEAVSYERHFHLISSFLLFCCDTACGRDILYHFALYFWTFVECVSTYITGKCLCCALQWWKL